MVERTVNLPLVQASVVLARSGPAFQLFVFEREMPLLSQRNPLAISGRGISNWCLIRFALVQDFSIGRGLACLADVDSGFDCCVFADCDFCD